MRKNKMFKIIIDNDECVYKVLRIGLNKKDIIDRLGCNGKIVSVEDVTEHYPINNYSVSEALRQQGFDETEIHAVESLIWFGYENVTFR